MRDRYLLDTNILIYYFNGIIEEEYITEILKNSFNISIISKIEFLSWQKFNLDKELNAQAMDFMSNAIIFDLDNIIAEKTIEIRQKFRIKTPDAIIGATAKVHGFDIVTNNVDDFKRLDLDIKTIKLK